jgi:hypothetical protein
MRLETGIKIISMRLFSDSILPFYPGQWPSRASFWKGTSGWLVRTAPLQALVGLWGCTT